MSVLVGGPILALIAWIYCALLARTSGIFFVLTAGIGAITRLIT